MFRQKVWDFWAKKYESLWVQKYSLGPTRRKIISYMGQKLQEDKEYNILDIGCGTGQLLNDIKKEFKDRKMKLIGIDFSTQMIKEAKKKNNSIDYKVMDVSRLKELGEKFDIILCTHSLPYYENQERALLSMREMITDDGFLLLAQASQNNYYDIIAMFFVKFTTGKAKYPTVKAINKMIIGYFQCENITKIKEKFYMPSIYFFALRKI